MRRRIFQIKNGRVGEGGGSLLKGAKKSLLGGGCGVEAEFHSQLFEEDEGENGLRPQAHKSRDVALKTKTKI